VPPDGASVRARCFVEGQAVGPLVRWEYHTYRSLFRTPLLRGGDPAVAVDVPVDALTPLRLVVGNGRDDCWSDWAALGAARFVMADGSEMNLADLDPLSSKQTYHQLIRKRIADAGTPLSISGTSFTHGLVASSEAELVYTVPAGAKRFCADVGVDDRGNPPNPAMLAQAGTITFAAEALLLPVRE